MMIRVVRSGAAFLTAAAMLSLGCLSSPDAAAAATRYALLVGVNEYRNLEGSDLVGPANDTAALLAYLTGTPSLDFQRRNITVLANGATEADGPPDSGAIMAELDRLAGKVAPGDFVYLHFGGHGTRQKARNPATEPDGLDELFLPADTGQKADGFYPNALIDDDIGAKIDAIRAGGAFVFAVFDSCHSSSATRAAGGTSTDVVARWLPDAAYASTPPPGADQLREASISAAEHAPAGGGEAGGLVTFFAAQTVETTPEMALPRGIAGAERRGLFSYMLLEILAKRPGITYRQLAEGVKHAYAVGNFTYPTPLFEGDLDRVVFGQEAVPPVLQWAVEVTGSAAKLPAGAVHGLTKDTILALVADPLAATDDAIGYVRVRSVEPMAAIVDPVEYGGMDAPALAKLPAGALARPVEIPLAFQLDVEVDAASEAFGDEVATVRRSIQQVADDKTLPLNLSVAEVGDLKLFVASEAQLYPGTSSDNAPRLWFLPPDGRLSSDVRMKPHSIGLDGGVTDERLKQIKENLAAVFRATSLARLADWSTLDTEKISVDFSIRRQGPAGTEALASTEVPVVSPGDEIHVSVDNKSLGPVDVDILLIGPNYSIQHMMGNRFQSGDRLETPLVGIGPTNFGLRRILLVMREARRNTPHTDLSFLEQLGIQTRSATPDGPRDFDQLIVDLAKGPASRASIPYRAKSALKGSLRSYAVESLPAAGGQ